MGFALKAKKINQRSRSLSIHFSQNLGLSGGNSKYKEENQKLKGAVIKLQNENTILRQK